MVRTKKGVEPLRDGKVVKAFRQTVTYADLSAALSEIGIN